MRSVLIGRVISLAALDAACVDTLASFDLTATLDVEGETQLSTVRRLRNQIMPRLPNQDLSIRLGLDNQGRLRITRQKPKGKLPQSTEELRAKIRLEAATWVMLSAKCKGRVYLRGLELSSFDRYLEYLLGDRCYSMQVSSGMPSSTASGQDGHTLPVPWSVLLQYEFEMRKWAVKEAHKRGEPLGDLLHEATRNTELKDLHFTSQVALAKRNQHDDPPPPPNKWLRKGEKGNKGKGKGKGKINVCS